jgi:hypothetical protein
LRTRSAVSGLTFAEPFIARDTVAVETLACFATALMFINSGECQLHRYTLHAHVKAYIILVYLQIPPAF